MARKITRNFKEELMEAQISGELVVIPYTREDGRRYDMTIKVEDFFDIKGRPYIWVLKDGYPGRYRSLRFDNIG